jgi:S1-C subfamily serine protease
MRASMLTKRWAVSWFAFWLASASLAATQVPPVAAPTDLEVQSRALERASQAVVGVQVLALEDARSNATLGRVRQGSGVVIDPDGLVLTIGYLVLEADQVQLILDDDRSVPARVVGYDLATGFGLLQPLAPLRITAAPLGGSRGVSSEESLLVASGGESGQLSMARLVSRRSFAGYWEYRIDDALFTAPPRTDHSGAGLFNSRGELVGIGSLMVADTRAESRDGPRLPGNMFVPTDLLQPILAELRTRGMSSASRRAWLGVNCVEQSGVVHVVRIAGDSPAEAAGLQVGDRIVAIDGTAVSTLDALWTRLWSGGPPERDVTLEIQRDGTRQSIGLRSIDRAQSIKRASGV